jgi:hypothetical protein
MHLKLDAGFPPIEEAACNLKGISPHILRLDPQIARCEVAVKHPLLEVRLNRLVLLVLDDPAATGCAKTGDLSAPPPREVEFGMCIHSTYPSLHIGIYVFI